MTSLGHMHRSVHVQRRGKSALSETIIDEKQSPLQDNSEDLEDHNIPDEVDEAEDQSHSQAGDVVIVYQSVAYSPSFQVPAFYFTVSDSRTSCFFKRF